MNILSMSLDLKDNYLLDQRGKEATIAPTFNYTLIIFKLYMNGI